MPEELILVIAGLALLSTIGRGLAVALNDEENREAALMTFLVTASGITLFGIGAAFWGLLAGILTTVVSKTVSSKTVISKTAISKAASSKAANSKTVR